jgi:ribonuclease HIII
MKIIKRLKAKYIKSQIQISISYIKNSHYNKIYKSVDNFCLNAGIDHVRSLLLKYENRDLK